MYREQLRTSSSIVHRTTPATPEIDALRRRVATLEQRLDGVDAIVDAVVPHLDRAGGPALLVLALRLQLAGGGPCPLSHTELATMIGCSSSTVANVVRLNAELGLLYSRTGSAQPGRRGPAPRSWGVALPQPAHCTSRPTSEHGEDGERVGESTSNIADGCVDARAPVLHPTTSRFEVVATVSPRATTPQCGPGPSRLDQDPSDRSLSHDPDPGIDHADERTSRQLLTTPLVSELIAIAASRLGQRQPDRLAAEIAPILADLKQRGWGEAELRALVLEAAEATAAYRPVHPAAYIATVLRQRLSTGGARRPARQRVAPDAPSVPSVAEPTSRSYPAAVPLAVGHDDTSDGAGIAIHLPQAPALPPELCWQLSRDALLARRPGDRPWLAPLRCLGLVDGTLLLAAPGRAHAARVVQRLGREIVAEMTQVAGSLVGPPVVVDIAASDKPPGAFPVRLVG